MGRQRHGVVVVLHLQAGLLRVPYHPEQHRVHVDGHQIARQRLLGAETRDHDALVGFKRGLLDEGNGEVEPRPLHAGELAETKDHHLLPLHGDMHRHGSHPRHKQRNHKPLDGEHAREHEPCAECRQEHDNGHESREYERACLRGAPLDVRVVALDARELGLLATSVLLGALLHGNHVLRTDQDFSS